MSDSKKALASILAKVFYFTHYFSLRTDFLFREQCGFFSSLASPRGLAESNKSFCCL